MDKIKLAVCAVFENEERYLPEWLAYHHLAGVGHFVLYDNGSTDDPARGVRASRLVEHVTLIPWPQRPGRMPVYRHFIDIFSPGFDWVAFIDVDEFLLPVNSRNVVDTLEWLSNAAAVLVHRRVFGPRAWQAPPPGLAIENYDRRAPDDFPANRDVRTIAKCSALLDVTQNLHEFQVHGPVFNTAGHMTPNSAVQAQPCYQNLVINHYYTRSRQDWLAKLQRNNAAADPTTPPDDPGEFDHLAAVCQVQDTTIQAFAVAVRDLLGLGSAGGPPPEATATGPVAVPAPTMSPAPQLSPAPVIAPASPEGQVSPAMPEPPALPEPLGLPDHAMLQPPALPEAAILHGPAAAGAVFAQHLAERPDAYPGSPPQPGAALSAPVEGAPAWVSRGQDAQERTGGLGLVFRDRSRAGEHWIAALRGAAVAAIDPAFLLDEYDRIREFPSDAEARAACDAALAQAPRH